MMKPIKIFRKGDREIRMSNRWDNMEISQWNHFVLLIYANNKKEKEEEEDEEEEKEEE
jgi:hypothetical protein